jgi:hypothetical protein
MKKLIIVCEDRLRKYGDYLAQLISLPNDKERASSGIMEGAVAAQVWSEKEYVANQAQISSEQYILFVGNSKLLKEKRTFFNEKFAKYGMMYGWLGKQAALVVENTVSVDEYDEYLSFAKVHQPETKSLIEGEYEPTLTLGALKEFVDDEVVPKTKKMLVDADIIPEGQEVTEITEVQDTEKNELTPMESFANAASLAAHSIDKHLIKLQKNIKKKSNNNKIEEQEYSTLVVLFYLQGLASFLGISEE